VKLVDSAKTCSCITLAFGINNSFKQELLNNTNTKHIVFMLLEKQDRPNPRSNKPFIPLTARNNVYQAILHQRSCLPVGARDECETAQGKRCLRAPKFLLMDPLGDDPIVVTGSANLVKHRRTTTTRTCFFVAISV